MSRHLGGAPVATMVIQDRGTLAGLLRDPEVSFGDAYMDGRIEVEGDLVAFSRGHLSGHGKLAGYRQLVFAAGVQVDGPLTGQLAPRIAQ